MTLFFAFILHSQDGLFLSRIACIVITNNFAYDNDAFGKTQEGGIGYRYVKMLLSSRKGGDCNFTIKVYVQPTGIYSPYPMVPLIPVMPLHNIHY